MNVPESGKDSHGSRVNPYFNPHFQLIGRELQPGYEVGVINEETLELASEEVEVLSPEAGTNPSIEELPPRTIKKVNMDLVRAAVPDNLDELAIVNGFGRTYEMNQGFLDIAKSKLQKEASVLVAVNATNTGAVGLTVGQIQSAGFEVLKTLYAADHDRELFDRAVVAYMGEDVYRREDGSIWVEPKGFITWMRPLGR